MEIFPLACRTGVIFVVVAFFRRAEASARRARGARHARREGRMQRDRQYNTKVVLDRFNMHPNVSEVRTILDIVDIKTKRIDVQASL